MNRTLKQVLFLFVLCSLGIVAYVIFMSQATTDEKLIFTLLFTAIVNVYAVLYAIHRDFFDSIANGIQLRIETPKELHSIIDLVQIERGATRGHYYHLIVVNERPHKAVVNCRVWLKKIYVLNHDSKWKERQQ